MDTNNSHMIVAKFLDHFRENNPTNKITPFNFHNSHSMAADRGYLIVRNAIPQSTALEWAKRVREDRTPRKNNKKVILYDMPEAVGIFNTFIKNRRSEVDQLFDSSRLAEGQPERGSCCILCPTEPTSKPPQISSSKNQVLFTIALEKLDENNGWWTMLEGSHRQPQGSPRERWVEVKPVLDPGDAIIFFTRLALMENTEGKGIFMSMLYDLLELGSGPV